MIAAFLPLPPAQGEQDLEKGPNVERTLKMRAYDFEQRRHENARWWRNLNRLMAFLGIAIIILIVSFWTLSNDSKDLRLTLDVAGNSSRCRNDGRVLKHGLAPQRSRAASPAQPSPSEYLHDATAGFSTPRSGIADHFGHFPELKSARSEHHSLPPSSNEQISSDWNPL